MDFEIVPVAVGTERADEVFALYRQHADTLGFLPRGAFDEFASAGNVLAAIHEGQPVGYVAFRIGRGGEAVIVHLCVHRSHRHVGIAPALVERVVQECPNVPCVKLSCREDYEEANALWRRLAFVVEGDRFGRGEDGARLLTWRREVTREVPPLLAHIQRAQVAGKKRVALDANVFFDLDEDTPRAEETKALLADWVQADVALCVTAELFNEIENTTDAARRERSRSRARTFHEFRAKPGEWSGVCERLATVLPPAKTPRDEADRRQLAHAIAEHAFAFVTRDEAILENADALRATFAVLVLRPLDLVLQLHAGSAPDVYEPRRLVGTTIRTYAPSGADRPGIEERFQRRAFGEARADWLGRVRDALGDPHRVEVRLVARQGEDLPFVAYAVEPDGAEALVVRLLRAVSHPLATTVLRRVLVELTTRAVASGRAAVQVVDDIAGGPVEEALRDTGFEAFSGSWWRGAVRGITPGREAIACVTQVVPAPLREVLPATIGTAEAADLERRFWPLKVTDAGVASYIIPIKPDWAGELFDTRLAEGRLFGAAPRLALGLENVYYSRSRIRIPSGARVLWYVSRDRATVMQVRAASVCVETVEGTAKDLFRKFQRLGVYTWADVRDAAGGPHETLRAYRFTHSERFDTPVPWAVLQASLMGHTGRENPIASPVAISEAVFIDVYRKGMGL